MLPQRAVPFCVIGLGKSQGHHPALTKSLLYQTISRHDRREGRDHLIGDRQLCREEIT